MVAAVGNGKGNLLGSINKADQDRQTLSEKLASGKRINRAKDDAAGLAIVASLEADVKQLEQAVRNNQDAVSAITIAEGAASQVTDVTARMQELATQASNGTLSDEQRSSLATEFNALRDELGRITQTTEFNGQKLLTGDDITAQVGKDSTANSQITVKGVDLPQEISKLTSLDISTQAGAQAALEPLADFASQSSSLRGELGAVTSRLQAAEENSRSTANNSEAAASRIRDADVAQTAAELTAANIRSQASVALQAHQNLSTSHVMDLLR